MNDLSTRSRVMLLVVVSALPAFALTLYSAFEQRRTAKDGAQADLIRITRLAAREQLQIVEGARQTLIASSQVLAGMKGDRAACNRYLAGLLAQNHGRYYTMGLLDAQGRLVCSAVPWKGAFSAADRGYFQRARKQGEFSVGEYQTGRVTKQEGVNFGYPVKGTDGKVAAVAFVGFDLESFNRVAAATPLPADSNITVLDRSGIVIGRYPITAAVQAGEKLQNKSVLEAVFASSDGVFEGARLDGVKRLYVHEAVMRDSDGEIPIRILVSLSLEEIFADANRALVRNLAAIAAATMLLVLLSWYGTELFVLRSARALLGAARRVRAGDLGARTGLASASDELSQLGQAFDEMAETLQRRESELHQVMQELREQTITDPLTGLYNRRYLRDVLTRELMRAKRKKSPLAALMVDLDHFKRINDSLGHEAGDAVLREVGALLKRSVRGSDIVCRYGGEEFALLMPDATLESAQRRAEEIRAAIRRLEPQFQGKSAGSLSTSVGVALFPNHAGETESLLAKADEALYRAKGEGRDRVVMSDSVAPQEAADPRSRSVPAS